MDPELLLELLRQGRLAGLASDPQSLYAQSDRQVRNAAGDDAVGLLEWIGSTANAVGQGAMGGLLTMILQEPGSPGEQAALELVGA